MEKYIGLIQEYIKWLSEHIWIFAILGAVLNSIVIYGFFFGNFFDKPVFNKKKSRVSIFKKILILLIINAIIFGIPFLIFYNEEFSSKEMKIKNIAFEIPKEYKKMGVIEGNGGYEESWKSVIINEKESAGIVLYVYERRASIAFTDFVSCMKASDGLDYSKLEWEEVNTDQYKIYNSVLLDTEDKLKKGTYIYQSNSNDQYIIVFYYFCEKKDFKNIDKDIQLLIDTISISPKEYDYNNSDVLQLGMSKDKVKKMMQSIGTPQIYSHSEIMKKAYNNDYRPYNDYMILEKEEDKTVETWVYTYDSIVIYLNFDNKDRLKSYMFSIMNQYIKCLEILVDEYGEPTESYINGEKLEFNIKNKDEYNNLLKGNAYISHRWILNDCHIVFKTGRWVERQSTSSEVFSTIKFDEWEKNDAK